MNANERRQRQLSLWSVEAITIFLSITISWLACFLNHLATSRPRDNSNDNSNKHRGGRSTDYKLLYRTRTNQPTSYY